MRGKSRIIATLAVAALFGAVSSSSAQQTVLRVAGSGTGQPYHFIDPLTNQQVGIAVDIVNAVAADLGMTVEWLPPTAIGDMIPAIQAGLIDTYANNIIITAARLEQLAFSIPWQVSPGDGVVVLRTDTTDYRSILDFRGLPIGAIRGAAPALAVAAMEPGYFAEIRLYEDNDALARAVIGGEIRGGLTARINLEYALVQGLYPELHIPANYQGTITVGGLYGFPFAKTATDLLARFNNSLNKLISDGAVREIFARYGLNYTDYTR